MHDCLTSPFQQYINQKKDLKNYLNQLDYAQAWFFGAMNKAIESGIISDSQNSNFSGFVSSYFSVDEINFYGIGWAPAHDEMHMMRFFEKYNATKAPRSTGSHFLFMPDGTARFQGCITIPIFSKHTNEIENFCFFYTKGNECFIPEYARIKDDLDQRIVFLNGDPKWTNPIVHKLIWLYYSGKTRFDADIVKDVERAFCAAQLAKKTVQKQRKEKSLFDLMEEKDENEDN